MEMRQQVLKFCDPFAECARDGARLERTQMDAYLRRGAADGFQQVGKARAV